MATPLLLLLLAHAEALSDQNRLLILGALNTWNKPRTSPDV